MSASLAESYGVSCITMMNVDEISVTTEDEIHHYTLLFAGLNNGHISLVYSNGKIYFMFIIAWCPICRGCC